MGAKEEPLRSPMGQVTTWRSQSTKNCDLSKPVPVRACQLGSSATGPMSATPIHPLALDQDPRVCIALIHQVLGLEQCPLLQRLMEDTQPCYYPRCRGRCLDIDNQMGRIYLTGFRQMDFIAHPLDLALRAIAGPPDHRGTR